MSINKLSVSNGPLGEQRYFLSIVIGLFSALLLCLSAIAGFKWFAASILGLIASFCLLIVARDLRSFFLVLAIFFLPIRLDFHLFFKKTEYAQLWGFPVNLFDLIFAFLLCHWFMELITGKRKFYFYSYLSVPAIGYLLLAFLSAFLSVDKALSFSMFMLLLKGYVVFLYFANNIKTEKEFLLLIIVLSSGVFLQSFVGTMQYLSGGGLGLDIFGEGDRSFRTSYMGLEALSRVGGTIGDANSLAMYLNIILPLMFCALLTDINKKIKYLIALLFLLGLFTEGLTLSRGGWIGLSGAMSFVFLVVFKRYFGSLLQSFILVSVIFVTVCFSVIVISDDVRARIFEDDYGSAYTRVPMMKVAANMIRKNPLLGVGLNNYATVMNRYDRTVENISYIFPYPVHNAFLIIAAESGVFALLMFLILLAGLFKKSLLFYRESHRKESMLGIGLICGILSWVIHAQVRMDYAGANMVVWLCIGVFVSLHHIISMKRESDSNCSDHAGSPQEREYGAKRYAGTLKTRGYT